MQTPCLEFRKVSVRGGWGLRGRDVEVLKRSRGRTMSRQIVGSKILLSSTSQTERMFAWLVH
jgi:hypothetical protein